MRVRLPLVAGLIAAGLAGCGGDDDDASPPTPTTATATVAEPAPLALARRRPGELVFNGATSPTTFGNVELDGTYLVRFQQHAPENPRLDFSTQTAFTARLRRQDSSGAGIELFSAAKASGRRTLKAKGTYMLEVTFGDFPYAVRFTPRR